MTLRLRPYRPADLDDVRTVCIRTGAAGADATGTLPDDGILPDVFAEPYLVLEPDLVTVVEDTTTGRVVGYLVGTADTDRFLAAWRDRWHPLVADRHPAPVAEPVAPYERLVAAFHDPVRLRPRWADTHPAHLHVDLLAQARGHGLGRALVERFVEQVRAAGADGVHLGVAADNRDAQAFYDRTGFTRLAAEDGIVWFGRPV